MTIGDGHDLQAQRFAGDLVLEACYDDEHRMTISENGPAVAKVQQALVDAGYNLPLFGVDGKYGQETFDAVARFKRDRHIEPSDGVVGPKTMEALNTLYLGEINLDPVIIVVDGCPPILSIPGKASTYAEYINLVSCVERALPQLSPRQILSFLRQVYFSGKDWNSVITCGVHFGNLDQLLSQNLLTVLRHTQAVNDPATSTQTDISHVFAGLDAMCCPNPTVTLERVWVDFPRTIPNEEWATWVGDLGSAVAEKLHDEGGTIGPNPLPWSNYFSPTSGAANFPDLEGDIDSYAIRQALTRVSCPASAMTPLTESDFIDTSMSVILEEYYSALDTPIGAARVPRYRCFAQAIGCSISGNQITNKANIREPISDRVLGFARLWAFHVGFFAQMSGAGLQVYSIQLTDLFLDWLEQRIV